MVLGIFSWLEIVLSSQIMFFVFFDDFSAQLLSFPRDILAFALNSWFSTTTAIRSLVLERAASVVQVCAFRVTESSLKSKPREFCKLCKGYGEGPYMGKLPPMRFL